VIRHTAEKFGFIVYSKLSEDQVDAAIDAQIDYYSRLGIEFEWKVYDYDQPADLKERLSQRGFEIGEAEALVVLDLQEHPEVPAYPVSPLVRRITDAQGVDAIMQMEESVWGTSHAQHAEHMKRGTEKPSRPVGNLCGLRWRAGWSARPGSTSIPEQEFASLWGGSTLPAYRRQGLYTSLLAVRALEAQNQGYRFLTVDASPMSRPILEKYGFQLLGFSYPCEWKPEQAITRAGGIKRSTHPLGIFLIPGQFSLQHLIFQVGACHNHTHKQCGWNKCPPRTERQRGQQHIEQ
jgi:GNAT superfamily N-acetyltransferase